MATRLQIVPTAFRKPGQRRPRTEQGDFLAFVRSCPCLICNTTHNIQAAHIRFPSAMHGKPLTGVGTKPDDRHCVPLCESHHLMGPEAQHRSGELEWWKRQKIDPLIIAALLYSSFSVGDEDGATTIAVHAREITRNAGWFALA